MPRENIAAFRPHWPAGLEQGESYRLHCDDNRHAYLSVLVGPDGDVWLAMAEPRVDGVTGKPRVEDVPGVGRIPLLDSLPTVRNRTFHGGGRHLRTHQALLWLALAIKLDNADLGVTK
jgi:hypothetical protein